MPRNAEYVMIAYGIVISVLTLYGASILLKLKAVNTRIKALKPKNDHEQ
ncbi:hypothetical protein KKA14_13825 [bacterium]|nr:hypothetical protein [bacterium]